MTGSECLLTLSGLKSGQGICFLSPDLHTDKEAFALAEELMHRLTQNVEMRKQNQKTKTSKDFSYLESICRSLTEEERQRLPTEIRARIANGGTLDVLSLVNLAEKCKEDRPK